MTAVGNSASRQAAAIRARARRGVWRRVTAALGVNREAVRADAQAALWTLGGEWEQRTAAMLAPLQALGWRIIHDRALPGYGKANLDHVLTPPSASLASAGPVIVLDTKRWDFQQPTSLIGGRVHCGSEDRHEQIEKVGRYAVRVAGLLGLPAHAVLPMLVVHGSQIVSPGFPAGRLEASAEAWSGVVHVLGPRWLVPTLASSFKGSDPRSAVLAQHVARVLPPYQR